MQIQDHLRVQRYLQALSKNNKSDKTGFVESALD
jgi:hypothetical protein